MLIENISERGLDTKLRTKKSPTGEPVRDFFIKYRSRLNLDDSILLFSYRQFELAIALSIETKHPNHQALFFQQLPVVF